MARPIMPTSTLHGKKAIKFIQDLQKDQNNKTFIPKMRAEKEAILAILNKIDSDARK